MLIIIIMQTAIEKIRIMLLKRYPHPASLIFLMVKLHYNIVGFIQEKDAISQYDYWVHAIFFFASLGLMTVLYFKTDLGWSFLIYEWEWETPTPCAGHKGMETEAVPIGPKKDPRELGFILPEEPITRPEEEKVPEDELCKIKHVANLAVVLFRTFTVIMLVSIARTVSAFKKLSVKG